MPDAAGGPGGAPDSGGPPLELLVNGAQHHVRAGPGTPLLFVLRNDLGLTAAKLGCGLEQCGACAVLVSVSHSSTAVRHAAADLRRRLLRAAAAVLGCSPGDLAVDDGVVRAPGGGSTTWWDMLEAASLTGPIDLSAPVKAPEERRLVGKPGARPDLAALIAGSARFVHDLAFPGMLHARVVRPPRPGARVRAA